MTSLQQFATHLRDPEVVEVIVPEDVNVLIRAEGLALLDQEWPSEEADALIYGLAQSILSGNEALRDQVTENVLQGEQVAPCLRVVGCAYYAYQLPLYLAVGDTLLLHSTAIYNHTYPALFPFLTDDAGDRERWPRPSVGAGELPSILLLPRPENRFYDFLVTRQIFEYTANIYDPFPDEEDAQPVGHEEWNELSLLLQDMEQVTHLPGWLAGLQRTYGENVFRSALFEGVADILGKALCENPKFHAARFADLFNVNTLYEGAVRTASGAVVDAEHVFFKTFRDLTLQRLLPRYWIDDRSFHADPLYRAMDAKVRLAVHRRLVAAGHAGLLQ